jgi:cellulose synthase/poly-beta-1,6-N-acetylglucosamine synthase-like glycosyltransferase
MAQRRALLAIPHRLLAQILNTHIVPLSNGTAWAVGVVIPAQNEQATIQRCLMSVLASCDATDRCGPAWIVVVADQCTDRTVELARQALGFRGQVLTCAAGSPGTARRLGVAAVMQHFKDLDPRQVWLANTDADTHVPLNWIGTHLEHADANAGAVAGIVELDTHGLRSDVRELYRTTYTLDPDGSHPHVHGANLGVRADAYLDAGGWSDVSVAEDHCLWGRLMGRGWRLRSPASSVVLTSGRLQGRAKGGFADTLRRELGLDDCKLAAHD